MNPGGCDLIEVILAQVTSWLLLDHVGGTGGCECKLLSMLFKAFTSGPRHLLSFSFHYSPPYSVIFTNSYQAMHF